MQRIKEDAEELAGDNPEVAEAAERIRTIRAPDEDHARVFRIEAIADLMDAIVEAKADAKPQAKQKAKPQTKQRTSKQSRADG